MLAAVARDLRRGFGEHYRILRAGSGTGGARAAGRAAPPRRDAVAMLIADQRMPGMEGTEYLLQARKVYPEAKRVLLTAYADTEAAIAAINEVGARLLPAQAVGPARGAAVPVVEDLLTTWEAGAALEAGGRARDRPSLLQGHA